MVCRSIYILLRFSWAQLMILIYTEAVKAAGYKNMQTIFNAETIFFSNDYSFTNLQVTEKKKLRIWNFENKHFLLTLAKGLLETTKDIWSTPNSHLFKIDKIYLNSGFHYFVRKETLPPIDEQHCANVVHKTCSMIPRRNSCKAKIYLVNELGQYSVSFISTISNPLKWRKERFGITRHCNYV